MAPHYSYRAHLSSTLRVFRVLFTSTLFSGFLAPNLAGSLTKTAYAASLPAAEGRNMAVATDASEASKAAFQMMEQGGNAIDAAVSAALCLGVVRPMGSGLGGGGFALVYLAQTKEIIALDFREKAPQNLNTTLLSSFSFPTAHQGVSVGVPGEPKGLEWLASHYGTKSLAEDAKAAIRLAEQGFFVSYRLSNGFETFGSRLLPSVISAPLQNGNPNSSLTSTSATGAPHAPSTQSLTPEQSANVPPLELASFLTSFTTQNTQDTKAPLSFKVYHSRLKRPLLAETLKRYAAEGSSFFHKGPLAQKIVDTVQAAGGSLSLSDLEHYDIALRIPLEAHIGKLATYTFPAPSAGGLMLLQALKTFGPFLPFSSRLPNSPAKGTLITEKETQNEPHSPLFSMGFGSSNYLHFLAESMRYSFSDRLRFASDPDQDPLVVSDFSRLLEDSFLTNRKEQFDPNQTSQVPEILSRESGTSHIVTADAFGNIVSLTTTINSPFGSGLEVPGTGLLLNDELYDFQHASDSAENALSAFSDTLFKNKPKANARPVSSMTPVLIFEEVSSPENGKTLLKPVLASGGSGGQKIATGVTQAVLCRLVFGYDPLTCVSAPRVHIGAGTKLFVEEEFSRDVLENLIKRGEHPEKDSGTPAVQMIAWEHFPSGHRLLSASDPRKSGFALAK